MDKSKTKGLAIYAVSRSVGKQLGESALTAKLREKRKASGQGRSSDESESENETEPGAKILHKLFNRKVVLLSNDVVVKSGKRIVIGEAEALRVAARAGIPAPRVLGVNTIHEPEIRMSRVQGQPLDTLWHDMSDDQKKDIARQLRSIVEKMRAATPPANLIIGACDRTEIRDTRVHFTFHAPACQDEMAFNNYLSAALKEHTPPLVREALVRLLQTDHRIVLSHCDLTPRNIMVQDGIIQGLVDWEDSGWYPEYWEYVKFFQRPSDRDWKLYAEEIFPELYHQELAHFIALSKYQDT